MSSGGGKGGGGDVKTYYGTIGGVVCAGPVDELVSLILDGATVWPTTKHWADGVVDVPVLYVWRQGNAARIGFASPHTLQRKQYFVLSEMADESFNTAGATLITDANDEVVKWGNAGPNVAKTYVTSGKVTKVVAYKTGNLVAYAGAIWRAKQDHMGTPDKAPLNATYWESYQVQRSSSANPFAFTVEGYGQAYFYWGTADQELDVVGEQTLSQAGHPPYRRQALLVLKKFLFGQERQSAPNVEVVVRRRPAQTTVVGAAAELDSEWQANPVAVLAELAADGVYGLGKAQSLFDKPSWQAVADALATAPEKTYVSPFIDAVGSARTVFGAMLAYYDGWLRFNRMGMIEAGRFLHNEAPPAFTAEQTIDYNDLTEEIAWDAEGWASTYNETVVKFNDRMRAFKEAARLWVSGFNRAVVQEPRKVLLERPWITRETQAASYAAEWGKINAQGNLSGSLTVRAEKAKSINAGDLFRLTHDALQFSVVCRCIGKTIAAPPVGKVTLRFANERGIAPIPYYPTLAEPGGTALPRAESVALYQFWQPPPLLVGSSDFRLAVLAARTSSLTRGLKPWLQVDDAELFYQLGEQRDWAVTGALTQNYAADLPEAGTEPPDDDTETLQMAFTEFTVQEDLEHISATQTEDAINDNAVLVVVFKAADPTQFEVMTLKAIRLDAGVYKLKVRRGRFGTTALVFTTGDSAWIIYRSELVSYTHEEFANYVQNGTPATFRLQAFTAADEADLTDTDVCPDIEYTFLDPYAPAVGWLSVKADGVEIADFATEFTAATVFTVRWEVTDSSADLTGFTLLVRQGSREQTVLAKTFPADDYQTGTTSFTLPGGGAWEVVGIASDASGRVRTDVMDNSILMEGDAGACATPVASPGSGDKPNSFVMSLSCATSGATIYYQIRASSQLEPDGDWDEYTESVLVRPITPTVVFVKATKTGLTDSSVGSYNYW